MKPKKGNMGVIGIDEVGRGPLAGPVTVCALYIKDEKETKRLFFENTIRDSKKLSIHRRINIFNTIRKNRKNNYIQYAVSSRSAQHVDKHGINNSIHACILSCLSKLKALGIEVEHLQINLDGGLTIRNPLLKQQSHIKGDENYTEIALASVMAKVTRDSYMKRVSKLFPHYSFENNVGYGTKDHIKAIKKYGITKHHRISYLSGILTIRKKLK